MVHPNTIEIIDALSYKQFKGRIPMSCPLIILLIKQRSITIILLNSSEYNCLCVTFEYINKATKIIGQMTTLVY